MKRKVIVHPPCPECEQQMFASGGNWIQGVENSIERRGTEGKCSGSNFGGPDCPQGSRQYNLAKTFRKMAAERKKALGGSTAPMGTDIDKYGKSRTNALQGFVSNNARNAVMEDFIVSGEMFDYGGISGDMSVYGYDPARAQLDPYIKQMTAQSQNIQNSLKGGLNAWNTASNIFTTQEHLKFNEKFLTPEQKAAIDRYKKDPNTYDANKLIETSGFAINPNQVSFNRYGGVPKFDLAGANTPAITPTNSSYWQNLSMGDPKETAEENLTMAERMRRAWADSYTLPVGHTVRVAAANQAKMDEKEQRRQSLLAEDEAERRAEIAATYPAGWDANIYFDDLLRESRARTGQAPLPESLNNESPYFSNKTAYPSTTPTSTTTNTTTPTSTTPTTTKTNTKKTNTSTTQTADARTAQAAMNRQKGTASTASTQPGTKTTTPLGNVSDDEIAGQTTGTRTSTVYNNPQSYMSSRSGHTTTRRALSPGNRIRSNYYQETYSLPQGAYTPGTQQGQPGPSPAVTQYGVVDPTTGAVYANKPLEGFQVFVPKARTTAVNKEALEAEKQAIADNDQIYDVVEDPTMIAAYGGNVPMFVEGGEGVYETPWGQNEYAQYSETQELDDDAKARRYATTIGAKYDTAAMVGNLINEPNYRDAVANRTQAQNVFTPMVGNRGMNTFNPIGVQAPNRQTPLQFAGMARYGGSKYKSGGAKKFKEGGTYNLSQAEINQILAMGGEIEYVD